MTLTSDIHTTSTAIANIKQAIINRGVVPTGNITTYAEAINKIPNAALPDKCTIQVVDWDGTILKRESLNIGDTFTLPTAPTGPSGTTFQGWSSPLTITNNQLTAVKGTITIGVNYSIADTTPQSGLSEFDISLNSRTGLAVTLNMDGTKNWGDGTTDTEKTHTYAEAGDYTITCNGTTIDSESWDFGLFGQKKRSSSVNSESNWYVTAVRFANITTIPEYVVANCQSLKSISIPSTIASIGEGAFRYCRALNSLKISSGVTSIGVQAFNYCCALKYLIIPNSVTSIGESAFKECYCLKFIFIPSSVTSIGYETFKYCRGVKYVVIPNSVTSIGNGAFQNIDSIESIAIPGSVTTIPSGMLNESWMKLVTVLEGVENIEGFYNCVPLEEVILPSTLKEIRDAAFQGCKSLKNIVIPNGVTLIGNSAFINCESLKTITIPSSVRSIGYDAFHNCFALTSVAIPSDSQLIQIGYSAFQDCQSLESILIPQGVTKIGNHSTFSGCVALNSITILGHITSIGSNTFSYCRSLTSLQVPSTVTSLESEFILEAFNLMELDLSQLTVIPAISVSSGTNYSFRYTNPELVIKVPQALYDEWVNSESWAYVRDNIVAV